MKRRFFVYFCLIIFAGCAFGAKYTVNSKGQVISPNGNVQTQSNALYNNYNANDYISSAKVNQGGIYTIDIVMDYSGSMYYWIQAAKNAMTKIIAQIPTGVNVGFRVFGNDTGSNPYNPMLSKVTAVVKNKDGKYNVKTQKEDYLGKRTSSCNATSSLVPVAPLDSAILLNKMNKTNVGGMTPLTFALNQAVELDFSGYDRINKKKIILITDGDENCGGDPCAFARALMQKRNDITVDVVLVSAYSRALSCLAQVTGGKIYNPDDGKDFIDSITDSIQSAPTEAKTPVEPHEEEQKYEYAPE